MVKKYTSAFFALLMVLTLSISCVATEVSIPDAPIDSFVLDEAQILSEETEQAINKFEERLQETADLFVVTVKTTGDMGVTEYAQKLYTDWKIGGSESDYSKGVLLLFSLNEDGDFGPTYSALTGEGLSSFFNDGELKNICTNFVEINFTNANYDLAAEVFAQQITDIIVGVEATPAPSQTPSATSTPSDETADEEGSSFLGTLWGIIKVILIIALILFVIFILLTIRANNIRKKKAAARRRNGGRRQPQRQPQRQTNRRPSNTRRR